MKKSLILIAFAAVHLAVVGASDAAGLELGAKIAKLQGKWNGTFHQDSHDLKGDFPVILKIDGGKGGEFTGTMEWPSFNGCKTKVEGGFDGKTIKWSETAYIKGDDVVLYGLYVAKLDAKNRITGDWMDPKHRINPGGPHYGVPGGSFVLSKH
jgi:hypothetical protein